MEEEFGHVLNSGTKATNKEDRGITDLNIASVNVKELSLKTPIKLDPAPTNKVTPHGNKKSNNYKKETDGRRQER